MTIDRKQGNKQAEKTYAATGEKLELRRKMGLITMVTPPSFFQNQNRSFCLINLSKKDKDNFATEINKYFPKDDLTIYLWDDNNFSALDPFQADDPEYEKYLENWKPNQKGRDYTWLLNACRASTTVILNMDYSSNQMKVWSGYILTMAKMPLTRPTISVATTSATPEYRSTKVGSSRFRKESAPGWRLKVKFDWATLSANWLVEVSIQELPKSLKLVRRPFEDTLVRRPHRLPRIRQPRHVID